MPVEAEIASARRDSEADFLIPLKLETIFARFVSSPPRLETGPASGLDWRKPVGTALSEEEIHGKAKSGGAFGTLRGLETEG